MLKYTIDYFPPGYGGENRLWDFSRYASVGKCRIVYYDRDSSNVITMRDGNQSLHLYQRHDTLYSFLKESSHHKICYVRPAVKIKYPFAYGDTLSSSFKGYGFYCGNHPYVENGVSVVSGDATGSLIISEGDTLKDVLRVYTLTSYSVRMGTNISALDTAGLKQVIEERYEWYAKGYRYPVFETITNTSYSDMEPIGTFQAACCCLPEEQSLLNDTVNMELQKADSLNNPPHDIIRYNILKNDGVINIVYDLDADAVISVLLAGPTGFVYRREEWSRPAGHGYSALINYRGLKQGVYILYINVNGKIYNSKLHI